MNESCIELHRLADRPEDAADFSRIRLAALTSDPDAFGELLAAVIGMDQAAWESRLSNTLARPGNAIFVARRASEVVGVAAFGIQVDDSTCGTMWSVFVREEHRGSGLAKRLIDVGLAWLKSLGLQRIETVVAAPNGRAIAFYRRIGFLIGPACGTLRAGSEIPVYRISMRLDH